MDFSEVAFLEGREVVGYGTDDAFDAAWIDGFVDSRQFHRAAESEGTVHGGDGEAGFGADAAEGWKLAGILEGQAIAFACLHGEFQVQCAGDFSGPNAATEDEFIGGNFTLAGFDGLDEACFRCEALHLGLPENLCLEAFQFGFDGGDESFGRKMAIFGEEDAACDIHGDGWIEGCGGFGI